MVPRSPWINFELTFERFSRYTRRDGSPLQSGRLLGGTRCNTDAAQRAHCLTKRTIFPSFEPRKFFHRNFYRFIFRYIIHSRGQWRSFPVEITSCWSPRHLSNAIRNKIVAKSPHGCVLIASTRNLALFHSATAVHVWNLSVYQEAKLILIKCI